MTTVSANGWVDPAWAISKLFSDATTDKASAVANAASRGDAAISSVSSLAKNAARVSSVEATLNAQSRSTATSPDILDMSKTADQLNAIIQSANAMTSQQINDAMYAGGGVPDLGGWAPAQDTFTSIIGTMKLAIDDANRASKIGSAVASEVQQEITTGVPTQMYSTPDFAIPEDETAPDSLSSWSHMATSNAETANELTTQVNLLEKAFNNHTLKFQTATDIVGLDYQNTAQFQGASDQPAEDETGSETYNANYNSQDGKQHTMVNFTTGVSLYLSW